MTKIVLNLSHSKETKNLKPKEMEKSVRAIINRTKEHGTLDGVILKNEEIRKLINQHLKKGTAKLFVDTEETLMYILK